VNKKVAFVAGIAALGLAIYVGSLLADPAAGARPAPTSKIAVVNLPLIIKNYKKYTVYEKELEELAKSYQKREEAIKNQMSAAQAKGQQATANRDAIEEELKELKRKGEDLGMEFKKVFAKKQEEQLVQLYREVEDMVKRVALSRNFEMVLQYSDAINPKDAYNPMIIQRKVLGGACLPMYAADGLDISTLVYQYLNQAYDQAQTGRAR
jgi:Skp family chaperone for outer membrane proteins